VTSRSFPLRTTCGASTYSKAEAYDGLRTTNPQGVGGRRSGQTGAALLILVVLIRWLETIMFQVSAACPYFLKDPPMDVKAVREPRSGPGRSRGRHSASGNG
jgi:hypothetical protein